jgi:CBS domain-containing protein
MENAPWIIASILLFILLLAVIVLLRHKFGEKFEIKNTDIILALLPIVIWLLLSGKLTSLQFGDLKFETVFNKAKNEAVVNQVYDLPVTSIIGVDKARITEIDRIIRSNPQALNFVLGDKSYVADVVNQYFLQLSGSTVKYIVFETGNREFAGLITLGELNLQLSGHGAPGQFSTEELVHWIISGDTDKISSIKGILTRSTSITKESSKQSALEMMEKNNTDIVPVVDKNNRLTGVVERSRLTASLLLDISKSLDKGN